MMRSLLILTVLAACGPKSAAPPVLTKVTQSAAKEITAYAFTSPAATGTITGNAIAVTVPFGTDITHLVATFATTGASVTIKGTKQVSGVTANDFYAPITYTIGAADGSTATYVVTVTVAIGTDKTITSFSLVGVDGTIDENAETIAVAVPSGTDAAALVATFTTTGARVNVGTIVQTSGTTRNDFRAPVTYTVTAGDGTTADYVVTVTVMSEVLSSAKAFIGFSLAATSGTIDESHKTISVTVPAATNVTALVATFATTGASVKVGSALQSSGTTPNNFTSPVSYTVTAADASTAVYVVTVTVAAAAIAAPTVSYPAAGADVVSPLTVQGAGEANATIHVSIKNGATVVVAATGTADASGIFNFTVAYTDPAAATALNVLVTQSVGAQTSVATTIGVDEGISGSLMFSYGGQGAGGTVADYSGTEVDVQVYATNTAGALPLQTVSNPVTAAAAAASGSATFTLAAAATTGTTYFAIAFRDANGNHVYDAGEPVTHTGTFAGEGVFQSTETQDSWNLAPP